MDEKHKIISATDEEANFIDEQIEVFNQLNIKQDRLVARKNYIIKDNQKIIAGINAIIYHFCMYIDVLWVDGQYRASGLGSKLLLKAEQDTKEMEITLIHLDTFDFQAKDFYIKHGFQVFGILEDCPAAGHKRYYMQKKFGI
jgi:ribosomal protein S18 acetylase RimI-like enzyme